MNIGWGDGPVLEARVLHTSDLRGSGSCAIITLRLFGCSHFSCAARARCGARHTGFCPIHSEMYPGFRLGVYYMCAWQWVRRANHAIANGALAMTNFEPEETL